MPDHTHTAHPERTGESARMRHRRRDHGAVRRRRIALTDNPIAGPLFAAPALLGLVLFVAVPFVVAIVFSFLRIRLNSPQAPRFVGFEQYVRLFTDGQLSSQFLQSLLNNFTFAVVIVPLQTVLALLLAVLVNRKLRGMVFFRTFIFMPLVFPLALVTIIWRLVFTRDDQGILNAVVGFLSAGAIGPHDWLADPSTAMGCIVVMSLWQSVSFQMIIILAGLQAVPAELYEAAALDRASGWQQFLHITIPGIRNTLIFVALITTITAFRLFDQVYILAQQGNLDLASTQTVMYQIVTTGFDQNNIGQACAMTVIFIALVVTIAFIQRRLVRQQEN